jgi:hypothetical protein
MGLKAGLEGTGGGWAGLKAGLEGTEIFTPKGFDDRTVQSIANRCTDFAIAVDPSGTY